MSCRHQQESPSDKVAKTPTNSASYTCTTFWPLAASVIEILVISLRPVGIGTPLTLSERMLKCA